jgi:membrane protein involved in colicin uptake
MKSIPIGVMLLLALSAFSAAQAQNKVYTWTDSRGKLHITDEAPPAEASVKEVVEAPVVTPADARQREHRRQQSEEARRQEQRRSEIEERLRLSREADERAQEAVRKADELTQQALEYRKRFGNTPSRREQFKYKIRAEEERAEAARAAAQRAIDQARTAAEGARTALNPPTAENQ